jgi:hypothetical protein
MEEQEVPTEGLSETINEKAEKEKDWSFYIAISTALIAVLAAITSLLAGHHSNEALIEQIKASDQWAFYQAKGIKAEVASLNRDNYFRDSLEKKYKVQQQDIKKEAEKDPKCIRNAFAKTHFACEVSDTISNRYCNFCYFHFIKKKKLMVFCNSRRNNRNWVFYKWIALKLNH